MAPSRGKGKGAAADTPQASRRTTRARTRQPVNNGVPDVYSAMLSEAHTDGESAEDRPLKKRRITPRKSEKREAPNAPVSQSTDSRKPRPAVQPTLRKAQTVEDSSESDGDAFDFEDVDIDHALEPADDSVEGIEDLSIAVQPESNAPPKVQSRQKPLGTIEKTHRLLVHKLHVLCLIGHCMFVNGRCNNAIAQRHLRSMLPSKTISYLNPSKQETQFQRNRSFMDGLEQAVGIFTAEYRVTSTGLQKPHWNVDGEAQQTTDADPVDSSDFITAAQSLEGSQDMANQLFCAMLRSAGVDARIVCSLQPLPFSSVPKAATPKKTAKARVMALPPYDHPARSHANEEDAAVSSSRVIGKVPSARRRLGQPSFAAEAPRPTVSHKKPAPVVKLSYPVFWVEAFNEANQKWVPVDPMVTHTVGKATKIEPPASYNLNQLAYAIAFEDDGTARDVTRRYAKAYNAKTRRHRVEAAIDGTRWWKQVMRVFRRQGGTLDRDQVEDAELAQKEAREGLPANVLDFKDHPYYALERHMKRHEVIHPKREVGKVNAGTPAKPRMESVYRRRDVLSCKSADKWYRSGREIKAGEQPLKHVPARVRRQASSEPNDVADRPATTGLYAPHQTQLYVPPPVQQGRIPRNMYGNLDIYVPSMIPAGGVHIRHTLTQQAAKLLRIDYADAITGFQFKGRHGTAIVEGAVVAEQYADAVRATIDGMELAALEDESRARSLRALKTWKRFLTGLRIAERVRAYGDASTTKPTHDGEDDDEMFASMAVTGTDAELLTAGRFSLKELERKKPSARKRKAVSSDSEEDFESDRDDRSDEEAGGFIVESDRDDHEGFLPDADDSGLFTEQENEDNGGGFVVEETAEDGHGGGFLPEAGDDNEGDGSRGDIFAQTAREGTADAELAGGFLPEEDHVERRYETLDDEHAGGFLPEAEDGNETDGSLVVTDEPITEHAGLDTVEITARKDLRSEIHDTLLEQHEHEASMTADGSVDCEMVEQTDQNPGLTAQVIGSNSTVDLPLTEAASLQDDESDKGSMLSHDPEDDEAEPDWLESD